jgi:UDP:flavonoid glycosyltransferase YjiC (YdhE family)
MRILVHALCEHGHIRPMLGLADAARSAGHDVLVVSEARGCDAAAKLGFDTARAPEPDFVSDVEAYHRRVATFADLSFAQRVAGIQSMFRERAELCVPTLLEAAADFRPDVIARERTALAGTIASEKLEVPGVIFDWLGSPWRPKQSLAQLRERWKLEPSDTSTVPSLVLLGGVPGWFETELLAEGQLIRPPLAPDPPAELPELPNTSGPLLYVTLGTVSIKNEPELLSRVLEAVGRSPVTALVTAPGAVERLRSECPDNARLFDFLPQGAVLDRVEGVVAHAGWGTIMDCLTRGLPMVCLPGRQTDNELNARRLERIGAGTVVPRDANTVERIQEALDALLSDTELRGAARSSKAAYEDMAPLADVIEDIQRFASTSAS